MLNQDDKLKIKEKFSLLKYLKLIKKYNTLKLEFDTLKSSVQDELYKTFMDKLGEPMENEKLKSENKKLRKKIKTLKEIIREDSLKNSSEKSSKSVKVKKNEK